MSVPVQSVPVQSVPVQSVPVQSVPVQSVPVQSVPVQSVPVQSVPVQSVPVQSVPVGSGPVQSGPVPSVPVQSVPVRCLSFRQPFAGLILDGVKTVESRWRPLLDPMQNQTLGIHIARRDWEGEEWRTVLSGPLGMNRAQIEALLESGERFGRGVVAGLVDVGPTWLCPAHLSEGELRPLERSAVLIGLEQKHLTQLSNPRWLREPISSHGGRDLWTVEIPAELLP